MLNPGDVIEDFTIRKEIKEGSSGTFFLVNDQKNEKIKFAMKLGSKMKSKDYFKQEISVLKNLQNSKHICRLIATGKIDNSYFFIVTLLWKDLTELRRRISRRKISLQSTLKIGIQCLNLSLIF